MGWTTKESQFDSQQGQEIYFFSKVSTLALEPIQPPTEQALFLGVEILEHGATFLACKRTIPNLT